VERSLEAGISRECLLLSLRTGKKEGREGVVGRRKKRMQLSSGFGRSHNALCSF
jgi:hypothetical protein